LLSSYIGKCKNKLSSWIKNIVEDESKEQEYFMVDNIPRTHCHQHLLSILNDQITINTQQSRGKPLVNAIIMILESMNEFQRLLKNHIDTNWESFDDQYFCAMINSWFDVSQKLKTKSDAILDQPDLYNIDDEEKSKLEDSFADTIRIFTNMAKECSSLLADKIFMDVLNEHIFDKLFSSSCFSNNDNGDIQSLVKTLKDYFEDFKRWMEEPYFYWEVIKEIIIIITDKYIKSLLSTKPNNLDCEDLADCIRNDIKILDEYFGNQDEFGATKELWSQKSKLLNAIHFVLECEDGFFDALAEPIKDDNQYGTKLLQYIRKIRKKREKKDHPKFAMMRKEKFLF